MLGEPIQADGDLRRLRVLYRALGDLTRLRIIRLLAEAGPMPVNKLSERVLLSQPLISWHLRILRMAGFIDTERHGREVICRLRPAAFGDLHAAEEALLSGAPRERDVALSAGDKGAARVG
ncbi:MAG: ArsR/SmtB family transcription factor [Candidatus Limnocylindria bacterium]